MSHLRAFLASNSIALVSAAPGLLLPQRALYLATLLRMSIVVALLSAFARGRKRWPVVGEILRMALVAAPIESAGAYWALRRAQPKQTWRAFVPMCFCFEIVFDLFHYLAHRLVHSDPWLYRMSGHKVHHQTSSPVPLDTFCQDPVDVILSNVVPMMLALAILDKVCGFRFSNAQLQVLLGYKTFLEVAGHVGDIESKATSFPQFVYLPRWLGIELRTRDHDLHHAMGGRSNFSKRFILWDKVFGTYEKM